MGYQPCANQTSYGQQILVSVSSIPQTLTYSTHFNHFSFFFTLPQNLKCKPNDGSYIILSHWETDGNVFFWTPPQTPFLPIWPVTSVFSLLAQHGHTPLTWSGCFEDEWLLVFIFLFRKVPFHFLPSSNMGLSRSSCSLVNCSNTGFLVLMRCCSYKVSPPGGLWAKGRWDLSVLLCNLSLYLVLNIFLNQILKKHAQILTAHISMVIQTVLHSLDIIP